MPSHHPPSEAFRCHYCQQPCQPSNYYQFQRPNIQGWECANHPYKVIYAASISGYFIAFYTWWYRDQEWRVEVYKLSDKLEWRLLEGYRPVITLNFLPSITPESIDRRMPTLLWFG